MRKHDSQRLNTLKKILRGNPKLRGVDYFRSAMIFQHGQTLELIKEAQRLAKKSSDLGHGSGKWLYAAATDRLLTMQGKKQKFGTQFKNLNGVWELHPVQETTTDQERRKHNVYSLQKIMLVLSSLNRKSQSYRVSKKTIGLTQRK